MQPSLRHLKHRNISDGSWETYGSKPSMITFRGGRGLSWRRRSHPLLPSRFVFRFNGVFPGLVGTSLFIMGGRRQCSTLLAIDCNMTAFGRSRNFRSCHMLDLRAIPIFDCPADDDMTNMDCELENLIRGGDHLIRNNSGVWENKRVGKRVLVQLGLCISQNLIGPCSSLPGHATQTTFCCHCHWVAPRL
ncbi:hypothetical protein BJ741DRAFT_602229 [Chytriomyces cf. hyalinus JEL632]|nr:hypothetical protein BJ741DRAFT_602229 [Chytriomyces cf. hyalinus JEL632]